VLNVATITIKAKDNRGSSMYGRYVCKNCAAEIVKFVNNHRMNIENKEGLEQVTTKCLYFEDTSYLHEEDVNKLIHFMTLHRLPDRLN